MAMKYDSRLCAVTTNFEWVVTGYTPITSSTTRKSVTTSQRWKYIAMYDTWATDGALSYEGTNFVESVAPPYPGGSSQDGAIIYTSGSGMADVTTTSGGDPIYGWGAVSTNHNHSSSISYDDGTYAGTLTLDSCSGTAPAPTYSGSSVGETATNTGTTTAFYSGDVPLKGSSGGGGSRPSNWNWTTLVSGSSTYEFGGVLRADVVSSIEWNSFCTRINDFRLYKNLPSYSFTTVPSKSSLTSSIYEEARLAISSMTNVPSSVSTGETGVNSKIQALSNALNQIS
jgi:hypothetical protein